MPGYHGKLLRVDLTGGRVGVQPLDDADLELFIGGAGIGAKLLYEETTAQADPLGPDNVLVAATGPFTGTRVPSSGRHHLMARSPLTGCLGESNVGGSWAVHFKKAGYDVLVLTGRSEKPVYLWIHDDDAELRDAGAIWGKDTYASAAWLKSHTHPKATCALIGPAGERLARIAGITHIGTIVRAAARTGLGAVMGSKNLKAMVAYGTRPVPVADPDALKASTKAILPRIRTATETFGKYGTSGGVENYEKIGNLPIENWRGSRWTGASKINGVVMHDTILTGRKACMMCPIACGRQIRITKGPYAPLDCEGPEYETLGTMGGECRVDDLAAICKANELANRYGLDTMSTGSVIAFAMEAYERGLLTPSDTDGVELTWGNGDALVEMVHKIGKREGIGRLMGEGSRKMAETLGGNAVGFAVHVKGLEPSAHDPRRFFSQAISYATAARGACHNASWSHPYELGLSMPEIGIKEPQDAYQTEGKAGFTIKLQNLMCLQDTLLICRFTQVGRAVSANDYADWFRMITGRETDVRSMMEVGERVFTLKRMYNTRLGISRKDDVLPPRFLTRNRKDEALTNQLPPLGRLLNDYYEKRRWDEFGIPTNDKIMDMGLGKFVSSTGLPL